MPVRPDIAPSTRIDFEPVADADEEQTQALDLLRRAIARRATDIHLDPFGDEIEVRFRVDGRLEHYCRLGDAIGKHLMSQLLIMASLDPSEPFHPREGRLALPPSLSDFDVRITSTPAASGRAVALRLLRRDQIIRPLDALGLAEGPFQEIARLTGPGEGVVLVSGPSGSGKSTTLYSLLHALDDGGRKIVTIEDPVEYLVPAFVQLQVDVRHGLRPRDELKTVLRMDPDVILIGEIRDSETAAAAMQAASCGKYVFSTFHSRDAAGVITGLRDLGVDDRSSATNLRAVVSQRLIRRVCRNCRRMMPPEAAERAQFEEEGLPPPAEVPVAVGCGECRGTGYHDRIGVFEIAPIGVDVIAAIEAGKGERELREVLRGAGVASLRHDALQKATDGLTTLEEVRQMSRLGRI